ncbi:MAG: hypothetical protein U0234_04175 [Sandaracinus sp.]
MSRFWRGVLGICSLTIAACDGVAPAIDAALADAGRGGSAVDAGADAPTPSDGGTDAARDDAGLDGGAGDDAGASDDDAGTSDAGASDAGANDAAITGDAGVLTFDVSAAVELSGAVSPDFGTTIAVSPDGALLAVGDPGAGGGGTGAVFVFVHDPAGWTLAQTLPGGPERTDFGAGVAFMPGTLALAIGDTSRSSTRDGTVDLYALEGARYAAAPYQTIAARSGTTYGATVAFSPDGGTLVVGDPLGGSGGILYFYDAATSTTFADSPRATLSAPGGRGRRFGVSAAFDPAGTTLFVGDDIDTATGGHVYAYPVAAGVVASTPSATIVAPSGTSEQFGSAIAVSPDGRALAIGTPHIAHDRPFGSVALYGLPLGATDPYDVLVPTRGESFGRGIAFAVDGSALFVGDANVNATSRYGTVYRLPAR